MAVDVASCIAPLLYEYDSVQIPGLGTVSATYAPSKIDHIQGVIRPPSKSLHFYTLQDEEADDRLIDFVAEKFELTTDEAQEAVVNYVLDLMQQVSEKEIVNIPKVGRLYKNYKGEFQFLQDNTNFNTQSFGLPALTYYPISREIPTTAKETATAKASSQEPATNIPPRSRRKKKRKVSQALAMLPIALLILAGSFAIYYFWRYTNDRAKIPLPVSEKRINTKPGWGDSLELDKDGTIKKAEKDKKPDGEVSNGKEPTDGQETELKQPLEDAANTTNTTESETVLQEKTSEFEEALPVKECIVIVGLFGNPANVEKLADRITRIDKYNLYTSPYKEMTRVGISFDCAQLDLQSELASIRREFDDKAWVLKQ